MQFLSCIIVSVCFAILSAEQLPLTQTLTNVNIILSHSVFVLIPFCHVVLNKNTVKINENILIYLFL